MTPFRNGTIAVGAFGGFVIPPMMAFAVKDLGRAGYAIGFIIFAVLALLSLALTWIVKYARVREAAARAPARVQAA
jgi:nitrate/nitrite transporter NarK